MGVAVEGMQKEISHAETEITTATTTTRTTGLETEIETAIGTKIRETMKTTAAPDEDETRPVGGESGAARSYDTNIIDAFFPFSACLQGVLWRCHVSKASGRARTRDGKSEFNVLSHGWLEWSLWCVGGGACFLLLEARQSQHMPSQGASSTAASRPIDETDRAASTLKALFAELASRQAGCPLDP